MAVVKRTELGLEAIPDDLTRSQAIYINVGELNFSNNNFSDIPEAIKLFSSMKKANFMSNKLTKISDHIFTLKGLETLNLNQNNTQFSFVRDLTNSTLLTLQFSMRFTLYEGQGQSVQKQLLPYDEELNTLLKKKYKYAYKGISIVRTEGPILRKPISWVVVSCVVIGCIVVCGLVGWLWKKQTTRRKECLLGEN